MIPCSCAASSASAICFAIGSASSSRNRAARDPLREILALDQLHDERVRAGRFLEPVDRGDVRMVQRGERLRLAFEPRDASGSAANASGRTLIAT